VTGPAPDTLAAGGWHRSIDLSRAVLLYRFFRLFRRFAVLVTIVSLLIFVASPSAVALCAAAAALAFYLCLRSLVRRLLIAWMSVGAAAAALFSALCFLQVVAALSAQFSIGFVLPFCGVLLAAYASARVRRLPDSMSDQSPVLETSGAFSVEPSFAETWFSGGLKTGFWIVVLYSLPLNTFLSVVPGADQTSFRFALAVAAALAVMWVFVPLIEALRDRSSIGFLRTVGRNRATAPRRSSLLFLLRQVPNVRRPLLWFVAAVLSLVPAISLPVLALQPDYREAVTGGWAAVVLISLSLAVACARRGRRHLFAAAAKAANLDEPFTLYLRSFLEDQTTVLRDGLFYRVWLVEPMFDVLRLVRFEEVLAEATWPFEPVVAIGRPGEALPELGALRLTVDSSEWQETIERLLERARHILMTVGFTSGLKWEFQQIDTPEKLAKLSLVLGVESQETGLRYWKEFASHSPGLRACPDDVVRQALAVRFSATGQPLFLLADSRSVAAYRLALDACRLPVDRVVDIFDRSAGRATV
jgi:hypothetical protein